MINTFAKGDSVRVHHQYTHFTTIGVDMTVTDVVIEDVDGELVTFYETNKPCSVNGPYYNDFELVKLDDTSKPFIFKMAIA